MTRNESGRRVANGVSCARKNASQRWVHGGSGEGKEKGCNTLEMHGGVEEWGARVGGVRSTKGGLYIAQRDGTGFGRTLRLCRET